MVECSSAFIILLVGVFFCFYNKPFLWSDRLFVCLAVWSCTNTTAERNVPETSMSRIPVCVGVQLLVQYDWSEVKNYMQESQPGKGLLSKLANGSLQVANWIYYISFSIRLFL